VQPLPCWAGVRRIYLRRCTGDPSPLRTWAEHLYAADLALSVSSLRDVACLTDDRCRVQLYARNLDGSTPQSIQRFLFQDKNPDPLASTCENLPDYNPPSPPRLNVPKPPALTGMVQRIVKPVSAYSAKGGSQISRILSSTIKYHTIP
jgi:hypothetical protein